MSEMPRLARQVCQMAGSFYLPAPVFPYAAASCQYIP
jgi:hypothetical protein